MFLKPVPCSTQVATGYLPAVNADTPYATIWTDSWSPLTSSKVRLIGAPGYSMRYTSLRRVTRMRSSSVDAPRLVGMPASVTTGMPTRLPTIP
jgi:hypothetical protein